MTGPINGSATAELMHWKTRALAAETSVRLLLGAVRDMTKHTDAAIAVAEKIAKEMPNG